MDMRCRHHVLKGNPDVDLGYNVPSTAATKPLLRDGLPGFNAGPIQIAIPYLQAPRSTCAIKLLFGKDVAPALCGPSDFAPALCGRSELDLSRCRADIMISLAMARGGRGFGVQSSGCRGLGI